MIKLINQEIGKRNCRNAEYRFEITDIHSTIIFKSLNFRSYDDAVQASDEVIKNFPEKNIILSPVKRSNTIGIFYDRMIHKWTYRIMDNKGRVVGACVRGFITRREAFVAASECKFKMLYNINCRIIRGVEYA